MNEYQVSYRISKPAIFGLIVLFFIFLIGVLIKCWALWVDPRPLDLIYLILFMVFFSFSTAAVWAFLIKKRPVISISSKHISLAVPYFFQIAKVPLLSIKEVKVSVWSRSEIIFQDSRGRRKHPFMSAFLSSEDRDSFLSNIFDLIPNTSVK